MLRCHKRILKINVVWDGLTGMRYIVLILNIFLYVRFSLTERSTPGFPGAFPQWLLVFFTETVLAAAILIPD